jgi:hypothetical protein
MECSSTSVVNASGNGNGGGAGLVRPVILPAADVATIHQAAVAKSKPCCPRWYSLRGLPGNCLRQTGTPATYYQIQKYLRPSLYDYVLFICARKKISSD